MNSIRELLPKTIRTVSVCLAGIALTLADGQRPLRAQGLLEETSGVSFSGQATAVNITDVHNFPSPIVICDTEPLPSSGGALQASAGVTSIANGALTLNMAHAIVVSAEADVKAQTSINEFFVEIMALDGTTSTLRATFIGSEANAFCDRNGNAAVSGSVHIEGLVLNGKAIKVRRAPNQVEFFPGGRLVINEQSSTVNGNSSHITVVAVHILVEGCMNGMIGFSEADITCGTSTPPAPTTCDKLTGGGWIVGTPSGEKGTFAVGGGIRRGEFWGHLNYIDHGTGMHVHATAVTGYAVDPNDSTCRIIDYNVTVNGSAGYTARVRACDKGEPGRDDIFQIQVSNGYFAGGDLGGDQPGGGNIQLHKCPPGWQ